MLDTYSIVLIIVIIVAIIFGIHLTLVKHPEVSVKESFKNIEPQPVKSREAIYYRTDIPLEKIDYDYKRDFGGNTIVSFNDHHKYITDIFSKISKNIKATDFEDYTYHKVDECQNIFMFVKKLLEEKINQNDVTYKELNYVNPIVKFNIQNERPTLYRVKSIENPELENVFLVEYVFTLNDARLDSSIDCIAKILFTGPEFKSKNFEILELRSLLDFGTSRFKEPCKDKYAPFQDLKIDFNF